MLFVGLCDAYDDAITVYTRPCRQVDHAFRQFVVNSEVGFMLWACMPLVAFTGYQMVAMRARSFQGDETELSNPYMVELKVE